MSRLCGRFVRSCHWARRVHPMHTWNLPHDDERDDFFELHSVCCRPLLRNCGRRRFIGLHKLHRGNVLGGHWGLGSVELLELRGGLVLAHKRSNSIDCVHKLRSGLVFRSHGCIGSIGLFELWGGHILSIKRRAELCRMRRGNLCTEHFDRSLHRVRRWHVPYNFRCIGLKQLRRMRGRYLLNLRWGVGLVKLRKLPCRKLLNYRRRVDFNQLQDLRRWHILDNNRGL